MRNLHKHFLMGLLLPASMLAQNQYIYNAPPVTNSATKPGYTLIFSDEFNGTSLSLGSGSGYNFETENPVFSFPADMGKVVNTTRSQNLNLSGGSLHMVTRKEIPAYNQSWVWQASPGNPYAAQYPNENNNGNGYNFDVTTSNIHTNKDFKYGYFEIRAKIPAGPRLWPSFWLFGQRNFTGGCTKNMCEIDCFEIFPTSYGSTYRLGANLHYTNEATCTFMDHSNCVHGWDPNCSAEPGHAEMAPFVLTDDDIRNSFNTYAVEWTPTTINFYFNNVLYLSETGTVPTNEIVERMRVILGTGLQYGGSSTWADMFNTLASSADFQIDYLRIYKKNPTITASPSNCKTGTLSYTATTGISGDTYIWTYPVSFVTGVSITSNSTSSTISFQLLPAYQNNSYTLSVAATGGASYESSVASIAIPDLNSDFSYGNPSCNTSTISITATAAASTPGSQWDIFNSDQYGNVSNWTSLQTLWGNSATFNTGLVADGYYVIKHGVWNGSCINWSETKKTIQVKLSTFSVSIPVCSGNAISVTASENSVTSGSEWQIFPCDINGNITNYSVPQQWGTSITFNNLTPDSYYKIKHGVWGGCGTWTESWKQIYVPNFVLNPDFTIAFSGSGSTINYSTTAVTNSFAHSHFWTIQNSDQYGNATTQIGATQWNSTASFTNLTNGSYYMIKHGVWNGCSNWDERRYLVHYSYGNPLRTDSTFLPENAQLIPFTPDSAYISNMLALVAQAGQNQSSAISPVIGMNISPNPSNGQFRIEYANASEQTDYLLQVFDGAGRIMQSMNFDGRSMVTSLNLESLADGIYFVRVSNPEATETKRIIITH